MAEERELMFRSLALCGVHIVVSLSNQNRFQFTETEMESHEVKEIHLMDPIFQGITDRLEDLNFKFKGIVKGWKVFAPSHLVLHHPGFEGSFRRGDIVQLNLAFSKSPAGTMAFVTEQEEGRITVVTMMDDKFTVYEREQIDHLIFISSKNSFLEWFKS